VARNDSDLQRARQLAFLAPLIFAVHVVEEGPRFVPYFNGLVDPDISVQLFLTVNAVAMLITLVAAVALGASLERGSGLVAVCWFAFLFLANAVFHIIATFVHQEYSPGVFTAAGLYIPYFVMLFRHAVRQRHVQPALAAIVAALGATPMVVHGYVIVFRGSRLF
jgi:hypothetical protein